MTAPLASAVFFLLMTTNMSLVGSVSSRLKIKMNSTDQRSVQTAIVSAVPVLDSPDYKRYITKLAAVAPLAAALVLTPKSSSAKDVVTDTKQTLTTDAYTDLGGLKMCKILTGMWQVSGAHGYEPQKQSAVSEMLHCAG